MIRVLYSISPLCGDIEIQKSPLHHTAQQQHAADGTALRR